MTTTSELARSVKSLSLAVGFTLCAMIIFLFMRLGEILYRYWLKKQKKRDWKNKILLPLKSSLEKSMRSRRSKKGKSQSVKNIKTKSAKSSKSSKRDSTREKSDRGKTAHVQGRSSRAKSERKARKMIKTSNSKVEDVVMMKSKETTTSGTRRPSQEPLPSQEELKKLHSKRKYARHGAAAANNSKRDLVFQV